MFTRRKTFSHLQVKRAVAEVLRIVRKDVKRISQEDLAAGAGLDRTYPSLLERSLRCPTLWVVINISEALDMEPDLFVKLVMSRLRQNESKGEIRCLLQ
jgi:transcriptional regulator with XRE-family HTH domain